jgi:hypothetical protein
LNPVQYQAGGGTSLERVFPHNHEILCGFAADLMYMVLQSLFFMTHIQLPCVYVVAEAL